MSTEQRENLEAILRQSAFPADSDIGEQRRQLRELTASQPLPANVSVTAAALGGVPTAKITIDAIGPAMFSCTFHGRVYVLGDAAGAAGLASQVGRRARAKVISVDYPLAPEHPYPAAADDARPPTKPSSERARPRRTSPSLGSPPAAALPSRPWSTPAITGCPCLLRPSPCHRMPFTCPGRPSTPNTRLTC